METRLGKVIQSEKQAKEEIHKLQVETENTKSEFESKIKSLSESFANEINTEKQSLMAQLTSLEDERNLLKSEVEQGNELPSRV